MRYEFNNARNCLRIFLRTTGIRELWMPFELCSALFKAVKAEGVTIKFYHINKNFEPTHEFPKEDFILYPNYFGICNPQAKILANKYQNFIYDATQSFFSEPLGIATIYSARKFFPVADGGILVTNIKISQNFPKETDHIEFSIDPLNFDYKSFLKNELRFNRDKDIKLISDKSLRHLKNLDLAKEYKTRRENFQKLHEILVSQNELQIPTDVVAPMVYPLLTKDINIAEKLLKQGVFLLQYNYLKDIIPIPLTISQCNSITL